ncbi:MULTISPECIES: helix-turn-helix domain-containing protein [unclassified Gordonia (in: high G+C Gram-positive bacteria)]|uniref:helix-turn-helix domain-containing protein n=1 Tax=unclassified Gordonia (in: high G+C Gram-positive bacteria) TaxID=2657482 RepID=UPI000990DF3F|nr:MULTISPECIES: helix-turn-helix transcriptional regulator [unclassified Gordonia (in: high G+C Gram-positive bacteria)]MCX2756594.1 helix-turn-helix transcriptional regulator [Gordonia sp. 4N]
MPAEYKPSRNPTLEAFGARVRARRDELGLSQEAAAERIGVHWTYLGQIERGQRSARVENVVKIAAGLGTTPGRLLDGIADE